MTRGWQVRALEATELSEQARAAEPVSMGLVRSQGLEQRVRLAPRAAADVDADADADAEREWAPWLPGTPTHARLMEIATATAAFQQASSTQA
jgi:hypothetical protein